ncbi:hypothetical protein OCH239_17145 [Roseivivax halodurans JCM 10272]|uniref:Uncharacterized protein n=1 Tax=Roseivivax halodurans JCM 10272 TaxID=1449350 RepID=X7EC62_9RHOB|nr:hypothetical protein OCH239_17145 [Roseivivax halodurans JCM 10272]
MHSPAPRSFGYPITADLAIGEHGKRDASSQNAVGVIEGVMVGARAFLLDFDQQVVLAVVATYPEILFGVILAAIALFRAILSQRSADSLVAPIAGLVVVIARE